MNAFKLLGQAVVYGGFAVLIWAFSQSPAVERVPADKALIKLSFAYGAGRKGECRKRTHEELMALAPNMRKPYDCPRERLPLYVELDIDGVTLVAETLPPTGLSGDGPSKVYRRLVVEPGERDIEARVRTTARDSGFDHVRHEIVDLKPGRNMAIDFRPGDGGFVFE